jgi:hypothetical protein
MDERATYVIQRSCRNEAQQAETPFAGSQPHSGCGRKRKNRGECASSSCLSGVSAAQIHGGYPFEGSERCAVRGRRFVLRMIGVVEVVRLVCVRPTTFSCRFNQPCQELG